MRHRHSKFHRSGPIGPFDKLRAGRLRTSRAADREGAAAVEFAITFPIILAIFLGTIELANLNYLRNLTNDAAFQVARKMIVPGADAKTATAETEQLLRELRVQGAEFNIQEDQNRVYVQVSVPIEENAWGIAGLVNNVMLAQECTLRKSLRLSN
jgi:hypothetical protein